MVLEYGGPSHNSNFSSTSPLVFLFASSRFMSSKLSPISRQRQASNLLPPSSNPYPTHPQP